MLLANWVPTRRSGGTGREAGEGRVLGVGQGAFGEPGGVAQQVKRGGEEQMEQAGLGEATVAGAATVAQADRLGDGALDAGALGVGGPEGGGLLLAAGGLDGLMERLGPQVRVRGWPGEATQAARTGQARQVAVAKRTRMTARPCSWRVFQDWLTRPWGQVTRAWSQSMAKAGRPWPVAWRACQLWSVASGPRRAHRWSAWLSCSRSTVT